VKIALLGGGGFRAPIVYRAIVEAAKELSVDTVVLQDVDENRLERITRVLTGIAEERGEGIPVALTTRLEEAVEDADFVLCAIRVGGLEGRVVDETVPLGQGVLGQETTGPAGICFALRTVPVMEAIAAVVAERAPRAWFLNFTNPAGLVTEALRDTLGDRAVGICDSPAALCRRVAAVLGRDPAELWFDYFGLNHLGWLRSVWSRDGDLLPALLGSDDRLASLDEGRLFGPELLRELRMIPNEYLAYYTFTERVVEALARAGSARAEYLLEQQRSFYEATPASPGEELGRWRRAERERHRTYMAEARPGAGPAIDSTLNGWDPGYAGVALDLIRAVAGESRQVLILNVANRSALPFLDGSAVVEVPCIAGASGIVAVAVGDVPEEQRRMIERMKEVERTTIRAARQGSADLAVTALAMHPLVPSEDAARRVFAGYLERHPGMRERLT